MNIVFWGKVRKGKSRGKNLGFPTANQCLSKNIDEGIYISISKFERRTYSSITFIGAAKTFNESTVQAETHILNFNKTIYNNWLSIRLLKKIRNNRKFTTVPDLIKQMNKDKKEAQEYFKTYSPELM